MDDDKKYCYKYPRPAVTTDCVLLSPDGGQMQVLLVERGHEPYKGCWALPGGFINIDEDAPAACRRELKEETGIAAGQLMQLGAYTKPDRDPRGRVISIVFLAYVDKRVEPKAGDDASKARWFKLTELPELAFDHAQIPRDVAAML